MLQLAQQIFNMFEDLSKDESDWIAANVNLIKEMGSEQSLTLLLDNLKGNYIRSTEGDN